MKSEEEQYLNDQANCGIKVGDEVTITRAAKTNERGWDNSWTRDMDKYIGKTSIVTDIRNKGIRVKDFGFSYPYFVLTKTNKNNNMEKLEITKEAVLRAADKCSTAKDILKEMFPQVFEKPSKSIKLTALKNDNNYAPVDRIFTRESTAALKIDTEHLIWVSGGGKYAETSFCLTEELDWKLEKDEGKMRLIPTRK